MLFRCGNNTVRGFSCVMETGSSHQTSQHKSSASRMNAQAQSQSTSRPDRLCVVSGRYPRTEFASCANHRAYCTRHGYTYINCEWPTGAKNRYLNKIHYLQEYLNHFDYLFWIDDDAFFIDLDQPLTDYSPAEDEFLSICRSPDFKKLKTFISSGQFMLRCNATSKAFLDGVAQSDLAEVGSWWDESLGYFTNGDQDAMVFLLKTKPQFRRFRRHEYSAFNSRFQNLAERERVFLLHFTGTVKVKMRHYRQSQSILGTGPTLLPKEMESTLNLIPRDSMAKRVTRQIYRIVKRPK